MSHQPQFPILYPHLRAWYKLVGSRYESIDNIVAQAITEKAPLDAVFKGGDGVWVRFQDITSPTVRGLVERIMREGR